VLANPTGIRMLKVTAILLVLGIGGFVGTHSFAQDLEKARQEGRLVFYTSWGTTDADYVTKAFEKKYPFVKVEIARSTSEKTLNRLLTEHRAQSFLGDVVAISGIQSGILKESGVLDRYQSFEAANFPSDWFDPQGYAYGLHQTIYVMGYNTRLVPPSAVPRDYDDLLEPRWKGQIGWEAEEYYLFGAFLKLKGPDKGLAFWRKLAAQKINFRNGYSLLAELVSAGEFPIAVSLYQHRVEEYIDKQAPIQSVITNPLIGGDPNRISLLKGASHPNAAKLFINFMLSLEGQKLLQDRGRSPGRFGLGPKNPRLKGVKIFTAHFNSREYTQLEKEFKKVFQTD
jgi:iron(III) transport system substrate-binding protein